jgi:putative transposase
LQCVWAVLHRSRRIPRARKRFKDDTFTLPDPAYLGFKRFNKNYGAVKILKVGWVKLRGWRPLGGELCSVTIRRKAGHWYASIAWRKEVPEPEPSNLPSVGIDRGVAVFAAFSDGRLVDPLNAFKRIQDRLAKAQRSLARKTKFSANWRKLKAKITSLHLWAANGRKDYLHKLSSEIAKSHGVVKAEDLRVRNMSASAKGTVENPERTSRRRAASTARSSIRAGECLRPCSATSCPSAAASSSRSARRTPRRHVPSAAW